jgi:hypothetical protein
MEEVWFGLTGMDWNGRSWVGRTKKWNLKKVGGEPKTRICEKNVHHNDKTWLE